MPQRWLQKWVRFKWKFVEYKEQIGFVFVIFALVRNFSLINSARMRRSSPPDTRKDSVIEAGVGEESNHCWVEVARPTGVLRAGFLAEFFPLIFSKS